MMKVNSVNRGGDGVPRKKSACSAALAEDTLSMSDGAKSAGAGSRAKSEAKARDPVRLSIRKEFQDLMNDWEIGGTQNPWVCPSDRHLQLRAQLKSGWSVRTASARSPTTSKQAMVNAGISEAEQEHIQQVLARAEAGRQNEQMRICKMMERLDRLRARATGNGVTQCLLCQTEFGLLAAKSYAAMCSDCRKYVCQRNCGVDTFDQKRREPIFLCKICSEYREVMWKKSGAWFYREVPLSLASSRPASALAGSLPAPPPPPLPLMANGTAQPQQSTSGNGSHTGPMPRRHLPLEASGSGTTGGSIGGQPPLRHPSRPDPPPPQHKQQRSRAPVPIPAEPQQRLKTTPRPRIIPSWVHEGLQQSSFSMDHDEDDSDAGDACVLGGASARRGSHSSSSSTSSSLEPAQHRKSLGAAKERALIVKQRAAASARTAGPTMITRKTQNAKNATLGGKQQLQRVLVGRPGRMTDSDESDGDAEGGCCDETLSRRSSPSTSPRHSLATPSSYGGDDNGAGSGGGGTGGHLQSGRNTAGTGGNGTNAHGEHTMSDSRSVDSGVVQSDHSAAQQQVAAVAANGLAAFAHSSQTNIAAPPPCAYPPHRPPPLPCPSDSQQRLSIQSPSPVPPPIPPRAATITAASTSALPMAPNTAPPYGPYPSYGAYPPTHQQPNAPGRPASAAASVAAAYASARARAARGGGGGDSVSSHESIPGRVGASGGGRDSRGTISGTQELAGVTASGSARSLVAPDAGGGSRRSTMSMSSAHAATSQPPLPEQPEVSRELVEVDEEEAGGSRTGDADSPAFMSSPEDDTSTLGSIQFNLTYLSQEKQLIIHLIRAKNLKAMDKNGFSDPYVKFHLLPGNIKATKLTSRTIEKTLNPEWNEEMIYYGITEEERQRKQLRVTVLDRDRIGSDFLGETRVALRKLPPGHTKKFNLYLEHAMPMAAMMMNGSGGGGNAEDQHNRHAANKRKDAERGKLLLAVQYNIQQGSLFVTVKRCAELLGMDSTGFSDPYCKVSLLPLASKAHRQRTTIKKRQLNPEFNETLQFIVPFKDLPKKSLVVGVYDYDVGRHDDYIGGIVLSTAAPGDRGQQWQQVIENPGKTFEHWHRLEVD